MVSIIMKDELIDARTFAERVGTTSKTISLLGARGILTRNKKKQYPWPPCRYEWEAYQKGRLIDKPLLKDLKAKKELTKNATADMHEHLAEEHIKIEDAAEDSIQQRKNDLKSMSTGEKIIEALKKGVSGSENSAFYWARALNESVKARQGMLELLETESKTLKREEVETWLYQVSRQNRDIWLNWPQRVSTEMAEQLGIDSRMMNDVLMAAVRKNLERIATLPARFGNNSGEDISEGTEASTQD